MVWSGKAVPSRFLSYVDNRYDTILNLKPLLIDSPWKLLTLPDLLMYVRGIGPTARIHPTRKLESPRKKDAMLVEPTG